ncbi:MAG TPA: hypothetical protein VHZ54_04685 [Solirubrobacterales bacterium]|nr:hypothetical protein [Solirubrobacterales bacterium]
MITLAGLGSGSAAAAGGKKLVEGTVFDATCVTICRPECPPPPHCGPITQSAKGAAVCAQRLIVCPLAQSTRAGAAPDFCIQGEPCGVSYPAYSGEGSLVNVRKRGSATVIARLPIVEGHFKLRLAPGDYVFHPYMAEEQCWSAAPVTTQITPKMRGAVPVTLDATNRCVVHTDVKLKPSSGVWRSFP